MAEKNNPIPFDPFVLDDVYPEAASLFGFEHKSITAISHEADIVLDTNVLLLLLNTGTRSIAEVERIYSNLIAQNRLFIPAQVAREFTKNKSEKIKNLYNQFSQKKQNNIKLSYCPLFEGLTEYRELEEQERELISRIDTYSKAVTKLLDVIKHWGSNDPVSSMYRRIGLESRVLNYTTKREEILSEKRKRYAHKLPPGYKDSHKDDEGIGDFLIWSEILSLGESNKKDLIFVTGEEKTDWWSKSANNELHVRYELIDEYRRKSNGASFHLINFSNFLKLFEATYEAIDQAKAAQLESNDETSELDFPCTPTNKNIAYDFPTFALAAESAAKNWVKTTLGGSIHSIRTNDHSADFVIGNESNDQIGFKAKAIRHVEHINRRIKELAQASKRFNSTKIGHSSAFRAIFIAESLQESIAASEFAKSSPTFDMDDFGYVIGYLDDETNFCEVFRSYDSFLDEIILL